MTNVERKRNALKSAARAFLWAEKHVGARSAEAAALFEDLCKASRSLVIAEADADPGHPDPEPEPRTFRGMTRVRAPKPIEKEEA